MASIISSKSFPKHLLHHTEVSLSTVKGDAIKVHGVAVVEIQIRGLRRSFSHRFYIAEVQHNILGMDFLSQDDLLIYCGTGTLHDKTTGINAYRNKTTNMCQLTKYSKISPQSKIQN